MPDTSQHALALRILRAGGVFLAVFVIGCAGYLWLGDGRWSFADAAYMVVITLSTVGYSEVLEGLDTTPGARGFTVLLILGGTGAMLYLTSALTAFIVESDLRGYLRRRQMDRTIGELQGHYVLCGLGRVGSHIARAVHQQGEQLVVIEQNAEKVERYAEELGFPLLCVVGDATEESVLLEAGIERAAGLVASLSDDRDNLFLVFTARSMAPKLRLVAKVVDPINDPKIRRAGADAVVSPANLGGVQLANALLHPHLANFLETLYDPADPHVIEEVRLESGPAIGRTLGSVGVRQHRGALVLAIRSASGSYRHNPDSDAVLADGDALIVLVAVDAVAGLRQALLNR